MFKMHQHPVRRSAGRKTVRRPKTRRRPGFLVLAQGLLLELLCLLALLAAISATGRSNQFLNGTACDVVPSGMTDWRR